MEEGLATRTITSESTEWLCWLQLVSPLSRTWRPSEIGLAVLKKFADANYRRDAERWWNRPHKRLTYEKVKKSDGFVESTIKRIFPVEFQRWQAERLDKRLRENPTFTNTLSKMLPAIRLRYVGTAGRPKESRGIKRDEWSVIDEGMGNTNVNLEIDEPKGWKLARMLLS